MRKYALFLVIAIASCSPQKRLTRLCTKHPQLCTYDTSYSDTLVTHTSVIDSSFYTSKQDTILIERYGVKTQIIRSYDTLHIQQSKTDTLIRREVVRSVVVKENNRVPLWLIVVAGLFVLLGIQKIKI